MLLLSFLGIGKTIPRGSLLMNLPHTRLKYWILKGGYAVLDQGIFSGSNFILYLLLARWMTTEQYGFFGVIFSSFLFIAGIYNAFFLEPISVIGPAKWTENIKKYYFLIILIHLVFFSIVSALLLITSVAANIFGMTKIAETFQILSVACPFILFFWLIRRLPYLENKPAQSLIGTSIYALIVILILILFARSQAFRSVKMAFAVLIVASLLASLVLLRRMKLKVKGVVHYADLKRIIHENYTYGKWAAAASIVSWLSFELYYMLTASLLGLEETGAYKALQNLISPLHQTITAFAILILPWFSKQSTLMKVSNLKNYLKMITLGLSGIAVLYSIVLISFDDSIVRLLYGDKYSEYLWMLPYLAIASVVVVLGSGSQIALKAFQLTGAIFVGVLCSAVTTVTIGTFLTIKLGIKGVAIGGILTALILTATLSLVCSKYLTRLESS